MMQSFKKLCLAGEIKDCVILGQNWTKNAHLPQNAFFRGKFHANHLSPYGTTGKKLKKL